jgi:hypothetical protein
MDGIMVVQGVTRGLILTIINKPVSKALKHAFSEGEGKI